MAAWYAALPVWKQLRKMNIQQDISARELISTRVNKIDEHFKEINKKVEIYLQDIWRNIYDQFCDDFIYDPDSINVHWAHDSEKTAIQIIGILQHQRNSRIDTETIEKTKEELSDKLRNLSDSLNSIHAPASLKGDPEISDEQQKELESIAKNARINFENVASSVEAARRNFEKVVQTEIVRMRRRIREIDDYLLREHDD